MKNGHNPSGRSGLTRRGFLTSVGTGAIGVAASGPVLGAGAPSAAPGLMPANQTAQISLRVNGRPHRVLVEPRWTLLYVLREAIGLTAAKPGCERGECGACTVLIDGKTVCSCLTLAHEAAGKPITTIEGLAADGRLTPLQEAFIAADALQCGFCTSGMILSCKVLLDRDAKPTRQAIREAVAGNLCRCGTYNHVFDAVERAAGMKKAELGPRPAPRIPPGVRLKPDPILEDDPRVAAAIREAMDEEGLV
jgi:xanthine dehydrogenase YagT iron-sulfur-binding subunit